MAVRAVLFDFYGTLARDTESFDIGEVLADRGYALPEHLREIWWSGDVDGIEHGAESQSRDHYVAWQQERLLGMLAAADVHPGEYEAILATLHAGRARRVLEAYPEAAEIVAALRERGLAVAVCSNWDWDLEPAIAEAGLAGAFDVVVSSAWAGARKPHPRIFRYTLDRLDAATGSGVQHVPADVLFVGDTWGPDVEGPRALGMRCAYLEREQHWPDPTAPADAVADSRVVTRVRDLNGVLELVADFE
jgi:putative hydrolase of the HAD superfamily